MIDCPANTAESVKNVQEAFMTDIVAAALAAVRHADALMRKTAIGPDESHTGQEMQAGDIMEVRGDGRENVPVRLMRQFGNGMWLTNTRDGMRAHWALEMTVPKGGKRGLGDDEDYSRIFDASRLDPADIYRLAGDGLSYEDTMKLIDEQLAYPL